MLVMTHQQMEMFRNAAARKFESKMLKHLAEFNPPLFKTAGITQTKLAIQRGIGQAKTHDFTFRGPVQFYLELAMIFGGDFDSDPQYPWVRKVLMAGEADNQMQRADTLFEKAIDYQEKVAGQEDKYLIEALRNYSFILQFPYDLPTTQYVQSVIGLFHKIYPQKVSYVGNEQLELLIRDAIDEAEQRGFIKVSDVTLVCTLMFMLGHGCLNDPLYPWIAQALTDKTLLTPESQAKQLEQNTLTWIEQLLANLNSGDK